MISNLMKQTFRYAGLLAVLPLLMISLAPSFLDVAEAKQAKGSPGHLDTRSYGSANSGVVCGDRLCNESSMVAYTKKVIHVDMPEFMPTIQNIQTSSFSGDSENTYSAIYEVTAGSQDITNVMVLVESDIDSMILPIGGIHANTGSTSIVRIMAEDPTTITATLVSFQLNN